MIGTRMGGNNTVVGMLRNISANAGRFLLAFALVFALSFAFLWILGAVPVAPSAEGDMVGEEPTAEEGGELPVRVAAVSIGLDAVIENPDSRDLSVLDRALERGVVRYPGSALPGERGNVLLFGHSSYLPVVGNSAYRTFNDIQKLRTGEELQVYARGREYRYRVTSVRFVNAAAPEAVIDLSPGTPRLTLVTCDSFRTKSDRFVVEAELVGSYPEA